MTDSIFMIVVTLAGVFGVRVQLSNLPVKVGVPGSQLETVEWLDVEVGPLDLYNEERNREEIRSDYKPKKAHDIYSQLFYCKT